MSNKVKWIKLDVDMFDNSKIKKIRRLPDGNNILLIWIMLLTMAGKCNAGGMIHITNNVLYTAEDLADELGFSVDTVKLALASLEQLGMIFLEDGIEIKNWSKYQSLDAIERKKERDREYQKKVRESKKNAIEEKSSDNRLTSDDSSYSISYSLSESNSYSLIINNIVSYLNNKLNTNYKSSSKNTVKHIKARLEEGFTEEDFYKVIDIKCGKWKDDPKMSPYLRPDTLFGTKFESYLNEKQVESSTQSFIDKWANV